MKRSRLIIAAVALVVAVGWIGRYFVEKARHAAVQVQETALFDSSAIARMGRVDLRFRTDPATQGRLYIKATPDRYPREAASEDMTPVILVYDPASMALSEATEDVWEAAQGGDCNGEPRGDGSGVSLGVTNNHDFGQFERGVGFKRVKIYGVAALRSRSTGLTTVLITRDRPMPARSVLGFMGGGGDDPRTQYFLEVYDVNSGKRIADPVRLPFTMRQSPTKLFISCDGRYAIAAQDDYERMSIVRLPLPYVNTP